MIFCQLPFKFGPLWWVTAKLLARCFSVDVTTCPRCKGSLSIAAVIDRWQIHRYLEHLHLDPHPPLITPAQYRQGELDFCVSST